MITGVVEAIAKAWVPVDAQDVVPLKTVRLGGHFLPSRAKDGAISPRLGNR